MRVIWNFITDEDSENYFREVADAMGELFGMSFEEAASRINQCYRGKSFLNAPELHHEMPEDEANEIVLGPYWWRETADRQLRPPPADYVGISVAVELNRSRTIPPYPDFPSMSSEDLGDYVIRGSYFHSVALGTLLARFEYSDVSPAIFRVLEFAPRIVFEKEGGVGVEHIVAMLIRFGDASVRLKAWELYDEMPDEAKGRTANDFRRVYKMELRRP